MRSISTSLRTSITGIYGIVCSMNNKIYVGSSYQISKRWADHQSLLRRGKHSIPRLQNDWSKFGAEAFELKILERCHLLELISKEQYWIDKFNASELGYNVRPDASHIGRHAESTKLKISTAHKGKSLSSPHRASIASAMLGQIRGAEQGLAFKRTLALRPQSRERIEDARRKPRSVEALKNLRRAQQRPEVQSKISVSNFGQRRTADQRARLSVAITEWWRIRKAV